MSFTSCKNYHFPADSINILLNLRIRISSLNNRRKYNGTTYQEDGDPDYVERIHIGDKYTNSYYEVQFTVKQLSEAQFCRGITKELKGTI